MAGDKHMIPRFPADRALVFTGGTWNKIAETIERLRPLPGAGMRADVTPSGTLLTPVIAAAAVRHRFQPFIGGTDRDQLFIAPGAALMFSVASEDRQDDDETADGKQITPVWPTIEGTAINAETPPSFNIGSRDSASVWLCTKRLLCGSTLLPFDDSPARLEIANRGEKPEKVDGEVHVLLTEMDFATADSGAKSIENLDARWQSDVMVPYVCVTDEENSNSDVSLLDSEDFDGSSDLSDVPNDSSDSGEDEDCPWTVGAEWVNKGNCYPRDRAVVGFRVRIRLSAKYFTKCDNWFAFISAPGGIVWTNVMDAGQVATGGTEIRVPLGALLTNHRTRFEFKPSKCKVPQFVKVRIVSDSPDPEDPDGKCCGAALGTKEVPAGQWPAWCGYNGGCGTTLA